jgi:two-component system LytT family response regulator
MKAVLVDDEPLARRELRRLLGAHPNVEIVGEAGGAAEATRVLEETAPDLVFLDIHMPQRTGFDLLAALEDAPQVIFTTAHDAYALQAFEVGAIDYLLKPVSPARLDAALARVSERLTGASAAHLPADRPLLVREGDRSWFVRLADIELFESVGNHAQLRFGSHRPMLLASLHHLEQRLDPTMFFRASRRYLVNLSFIEKVDVGVRGEVVARLRGGHVVPFSRRQSVVFRRRSTLG